MRHGSMRWTVIPVDNCDGPAHLIGIECGEESDCACADDRQALGSLGEAAAQAVDRHSGRVSEDGMEGMEPRWEDMDIPCQYQYLFGESAR